MKYPVPLIFLTGCTTINVTVAGDVVIDASKRIPIVTEAGVW